MHPSLLKHAGGTRVVLPAPGAAVTTTARDRRTSATMRSMNGSIGRLRAGCRMKLSTTEDTGDTEDRSYSYTGFTSVSSASTVVASFFRSRRVLTMCAPDLPEPGVAPAAGAVPLVHRRVRLVVVLVIRLGDPERRRRQHARHHALEPLRVLERFLRRLGPLLLRVAAIKDDGTVLRAEVAELAGTFGRIRVVPVGIEQRLVRDLRRIEDDAHRFDMTGDAELHLLVARTFCAASGIPGRHRLHAGDLVEDVLHAPEAAAAENRLLHARRQIARRLRRASDEHSNTKERKGR